MKFIEYVFLYITIYLGVLAAIGCKPLIFKKKEKKEEPKEEEPKKISFNRELYLKIVSAVERYKFNIAEKDKYEIIADAYECFESVFGTVSGYEMNCRLDEFIKTEMKSGLLEDL